MSDVSPTRDFADNSARSFVSLSARIDGLKRHNTAADELIQRLAKLPCDTQGDLRIGDRMTVEEDKRGGVTVAIDGAALDLEAPMYDDLETALAAFDPDNGRSGYVLADAIDAPLMELSRYHPEGAFCVEFTDRADDPDEADVTETVAFGLGERGRARALARHRASEAATELCETAAVGADRDPVNGPVYQPQFEMNDEPVRLAPNLSSRDGDHVSAEVSLDPVMYRRIMAAYGAIVGGIVDAARISAGTLASIDVDDVDFTDTAKHVATWLVGENGVQFVQHVPEHGVYQSPQIGWQELDDAIREPSPDPR